MKNRPSVLVADPDVRGRLWLMDALRIRCQLSSPGPGEEPLRAVRRVQPVAILLAVPRGRAREVDRLCQAIKTDSSQPPLIGIVDQWGRLRKPERLLQEGLTDGYIGGRVTTEDIHAFVVALLNREQPLQAKPAPSGLWTRLRHR